MDYIISRRVGNYQPDFVIRCTSLQVAEKKLSETVASELATMKPLFPDASFVCLRRVNAALVRFENYPFPVSITMIPLY